MLKLHVIIASTRPKRTGVPIANWFFEHAKAHGKFEVKLVDLKEVNLPFLDEEEHPRFGRYAHAHTKDWSETINAADAFVFVTPEYNYFAPAPLVNAIDFLGREWAYKAASFVSYGGVSGGTRSVQMAKQFATAVNMMPIMQGVFIPFAAKLIENDVFNGESQDKAASAMLDELHKWASALKPMRG